MNFIPCEDVAENIKLEPLELQDIEWARQLRNDPETRKWLAHTDEISAREQLGWFNNLEISETSGRHVATLDGEKFGIVRIDSYDMDNHSICVGLDIHPGFRGKGLASKTYKLILHLMFDLYGFNRVWLGVGEYNERAVHIYTKAGFREEGRQREAMRRDGKYYDYILMGILRSEYDESIKQRDPDVQSSHASGDDGSTEGDSR